MFVYIAPITRSVHFVVSISQKKYVSSADEYSSTRVINSSASPALITTPVSCRDWPWGVR